MMRRIVYVPWLNLSILKVSENESGDIMLILVPGEGITRGYRRHEDSEATLGRLLMGSCLNARGPLSEAVISR